MQKDPLRRVLAAFLFCTVSAGAWAGPTRPQVQAQVEAAVKHVKEVGLERAAKDVNSEPGWKAEGINVVIVDYKGTVLASSMNEKLVGRNTLEVKDPSGKQFTKDFIATARSGSGWVDYQFINPQTKQLEERSMFVKGGLAAEAFVGAAITK